MLFLTLVLIVLTAIIYFYERTVKPRNFPPGPKWNPISGSLATVTKLSVQFGGLHKAFEKLSQIYNSDVIGLKLGRTVTVCVVSDKLIKEVLSRDEFQERPNTFFSSLRSFGTNKGITFTRGEHWKVQRSFLLRHMRSLGYGKQKMDEMIVEEVKTIINNLNVRHTQQLGPFLAPSVLNILWALVAGERLDHDNIRLQNLLTLMEKRSKVFDVAGGSLSSWPWLRFIAPKAVGYDIILAINSDLKSLLMSVINEHYQDWYPGRNDDVIYAFITEMNETRDPSFTGDQLLMVCTDIFFGGAQTISNTLNFAIMCMILYPDIQRKVHEAINAAYPNGAMPEYKNRHLVPYLDAVMSEVLRYYLVIPIGGPRVAVSNTQLGSYSIPKGATVLLNTYSVNFDPKLWRDPENFRPERFLNQKGEVEIPQFFYPFSMGKRKCLADVFARNCLFTFFTGIMQAYLVTLQENAESLTGKPIPGINLSPEKYNACFTRRY